MSIQHQAFRATSAVTVSGRTWDAAYTREEELEIVRRQAVEEVLTEVEQLLGHGVFTVTLSLVELTGGHGNDTVIGWKADAQYNKPKVP